ncbi:MAG: hypothetical protein E6Q97_30965 [Desulfurellales bacterium]|nr:MAG: hypothetical protein E6Q97_30965 [Desulfurellales bacterium]
MALTEAQLLTVAKIVAVTVVDIEDQIEWLGAGYATSAWQTAVEAEITRWTTAGVDFVAIEPKEKNFGAKIDPTHAKNDIRRNLATLFQRPDWALTGGGAVRTIRG